MESINDIRKNYYQILELLKDNQRDKTITSMMVLKNAFKDKTVKHVRIVFGNDFALNFSNFAFTGYEKSFVVRKPEKIIESATSFEIIETQRKKEDNDDSSKSMLGNYEYTRKYTIFSDKIIQIQQNWDICKKS